VPHFALRSTVAAVGLIMSGLMIAGTAVAGPVQPFSMAALQAAQRAGKPVLVDVYADWCPTCRRQAPTIAAIARDPAFAKLVIFRLDYDKQTAEKAALNVRMQSTLITFNGPRERGRTTGVTDPVQIRALATAALK
jgi:thioredoxin 1